jgi:hypothetical protein
MSAAGGENFPYGFKGAPSARQIDGSWPCSWTMRGTCTEALNEAEVRGTDDQGSGDSPRRWRGSVARASCAEAHRRGPLPAAPMPRTGPQHQARRHAP